MGVKKELFSREKKKKMKKRKEEKSLIPWRLSSLVSSVPVEQRNYSQGVSCSQLQISWKAEPKGIMEYLRLEKTSKIIESNLSPNTTMTTKLQHWVPSPVSWTLLRLATPLPSWMMFNHSFREEIIPYVQPEAPLVQLEAMSPHPVAGCLVGEMSPIWPQPPFMWL